MTAYKANTKANTWRKFDSKTGILSDQAQAIPVGTIVQGDYAGEQAATEDDIIRLADGRYSKEKFFNEVPSTPPPSPPPAPSERTPFTLVVDGFKPFDGELTPV